MTKSAPQEMKTLRVKSYGAPADVLELDIASVPTPVAGRIRIRVHACAFNPADWAVCEGFLPLPAPRGIGFDVSGTVDAMGEGVSDALAMSFFFFDDVVVGPLRLRGMC